MIRAIGRWVRRLLQAPVALAILLALPAIWVEVACRPQGEPAPYEPLLPAAHHRPESRTLLTWPEWHIVHAYDDYAEVISAGDPHEFAFAGTVWGFWDSLCDMSRASGPHGGFGWETKQMAYVIGTSFTLEMGLKALYEETLGRAAAWLRGPGRAPTDMLSAEQAADYAAFLTQTPWYLYDFEADAAELSGVGRGLRDAERRVALRIEYGGKSAYAGVIEQAVGAVGGDALTMRSVVSGVPAAELRGMDGVTVIGDIDEGAVIETPRYRAFTSILRDLARTDGRIEEIAGNDEIMMTLLSDAPVEGALLSMPRQGYGDWRSLVLVPVPELLDRIRTLGDARLEHVHDY